MCFGWKYERLNLDRLSLTKKENNYETGTPHHTRQTYFYSTFHAEHVCKGDMKYNNDESN